MVIQQIRKLAENEGITIAELERVVGCSQGMLNKALKGNTDINAKWLTNIMENYPLYSALWLLTGDGDMIVREEKQYDVQTIHTPKQPDRLIDLQDVPLYEFEASAGLVQLFDNNRTAIIDTIRIPNLPRCDGAIHITGDSMYPILKSGDIVMYKSIPLGEEHLLYGEMYLLSYQFDYEDYVVVKYVKRASRQGYIQLVSYNEHHSPKEIPLASVTAIALIKASIRINSMG